MRRKLDSIWLLVAAGVGVTLLILATGLEGLSFAPGKPLALDWQSLFVVATSTSIKGMEAPVLLLRVLVILALIALPLAFVSDFKRALRDLTTALMWLLFFYLVLRVRNRGGGVPFNGRPMGLFSPLATPPAPLSGAAFPEVPAPASWMVLLVNGVVALAVAALAGGVIWALLRQKPAAPSALQRLRAEAEDALQSLRAGGAVKDVVLRCYFEMQRIVSEQHGLERGAAVTPREFARQLQHLGLPAAPVEELTHLFEAVRYGALTPGGAEEQRALACLQAIAGAEESA